MMEESKVNMSEPIASCSRTSPSFVVGIGASGGGLVSLEKLFRNLPADTGMAFVVIQHLSPDFKSMMYELLARDTKMEIHRVEDGMQIEANHIYLLPPKKEIIIAGGDLHLIDKDLSKGLTLPIDRFFESLYSENGWAVVTVRDEGSGIPADFLPRIFEPFVQSDETLDRSEGGLGVGLTLVKSLVELHHGTIEAFSDGRDSGSTFVVRIPLTTLCPDTGEAVTSNMDLNSKSNSTQNVTTKVKRIVLVEDIDDNREMLKSILELDGHEVIAAMDGEAGCDAILAEKPDVALIDIGLPGMNGYEVARHVRRYSACERVRLVALTGYGQSSDIETALDVGFDAHLVKPVDPKALATMLGSQTQ